jgi:hypothetical protein
MNVIKPAQTGEKLRWRSAVLIVGSLVIIAALFPSLANQGGVVRTDSEREFLSLNPASIPFRSDFTLGFQASPLVRRFSEANLVMDSAGGVTLRQSIGLEFGLRSWSMVGLVAGILLFAGALLAGTRGKAVADSEAILDKWQ